MQRKEFKGVAPYLSSEDNFADNLSVASSLPTSDDSEDSEDTTANETSDASLVNDMESFHLSRQVEWTECPVLQRESTTPPSPQAYFLEVCNALFPYNSSLTPPSLLTVFVDPHNVPIIVLAGNEVNVTQDAKQISEHFADIRVIAVPPGATLAPLFGRQLLELPEHYFRFINSNLKIHEYPSVLDIQLLDRTAIETSDAVKIGARRAVLLEEIHIRLLKSCPTLEREKARLNADYSDIDIDECDDPTGHPEVIYCPETMLRQVAGNFANVSPPNNALILS